MYRNFDFANTFSPSIVYNLHLAEDYLLLWKDAHGCILKIGASFEDLIVHHISVKENINFTFKAKLIQYIEYIEENNICPSKILEAMKVIHKKRNQSNHEGCNKEYDARLCLKKIHHILGWCITKYCLGKPTHYQSSNGFCDSFINFRNMLESLGILDIETC